MIFILFSSLAPFKLSHKRKLDSKQQVENEKKLSNELLKKITKYKNKMRMTKIN